MPITIKEKPDSRAWIKGESGVLIFTVKGTEDKAAAAAALEADPRAPATEDGLLRGKVSVEPLTRTVWLGTVQYRKLGTAMIKREPLVEGESSGYEFEIGGGSWHVATSLQTRARCGANALDFGGAINVSRDDDGNWEVAGVDLGDTAGALLFSETHCFAAEDVTDEYVKTLATLVWHYNLYAFKGFAAGEVLFIGARGSRRGDDLWEITFSYAAQPNREAFTIPEAPAPGEAYISIIGGKLGWDYVWVFFVTEPTDEGPLRRVPEWVYVEQVYPAGDFDDLLPV